MSVRIAPPPKTISEDAFQKEIIRLAEILGWRVMHVHDSRREVRGRNASYLVGDKQAKGWPDLTFAHPRWRQFGVRELKSNTGRETPEQREWLAALALCGIDAAVWRPRDWDDLVVPFLTNRRTTDNRR